MQNRQGRDLMKAPEILVLALDWWDQQSDEPLAIRPSLRKHMQNATEPLAEALHWIQAGHSVELFGPRGQAPLAVGLLLVAIKMRQSIDFVLTPQAWLETEWKAVTNTFEILLALPLTYRPGRTTISMGHVGPETVRQVAMVEEPS
jgi:hypothetical protein